MASITETQPPEGDPADLQMLDGDEIPPFANEANKALDAQVKSKQKRLGSIDNSVYQLTERVKVLGDHLVNVQQEVVNTQALVNAKKKEIDSEEHMKALNERQGGRIVVEMRRIGDVIQGYQVP